MDACAQLTASAFVESKVWRYPQGAGLLPSVKPVRIFPHRCAQHSISQVTLDLIKLTVEMNHHSPTKTCKLNLIYFWFHTEISAVSLCK